jgi:hypothetical protein
MIEAFKEVLGGALTFCSIIILVFIWASVCVLIKEVKNYFKI